jgi:uncharacterized membrane protein YfcA
LPEVLEKRFDGHDITIRFTQRPNHAYDLAKAAAADGYYAVIAVGGDGTVNETASALCHTATKLGIIPSGFFVEIFSYLFATMLIVGAIYKFWRIMSAKKTVDYPVWVFIIPSVVMVCGIVLFAVGIQIVQQWLALIVGIAFIVYSLHSLLESVLFERLRSKRTKQNVEDVDFVDIPDNDSH